MNTEHTAIRTPNNIEVLIHCHCRPEPHPRAHAPAVRDALQFLSIIGAIEPGPESTREDYVYQTTPLGRAWVQALCNTPVPQQRFVDTHGNIIET